MGLRMPPAVLPTPPKAPALVRACGVDGQWTDLEGVPLTRERQPGDKLTGTITGRSRLNRDEVWLGSIFKGLVELKQSPPFQPGSAAARTPGLPQTPFTAGRPV